MNAVERLDRMKGFLDQDPDNLQLLADVSDLALDAGEVDTARMCVQRALSTTPDDPYFALRLSSVAIAERNFEEAGFITQQLLDRGFTQEPILYNHAIALANLEKYNDAAQCLSSIPLNSDIEGAARLRIRCLHYLGEIDQAIDVANQYLATHPNALDVVSMLSLLHFDNDDLNQAECFADIALRSDKPGLDALLAKGGVELSKLNTVEAEQLLHHAIDIAPTNGRVWMQLGMTELAKLNLENAEKHLQRAVHYMPSHLGSWVALGWVLLLSNKLDQAEEMFNAAQARDDSFAETHSGLAAIAAIKGDFKTAEHLNKVARRLDPNILSNQFVELMRLKAEGRENVAPEFIRNILEKHTLPNGMTLQALLSKALSTKKPKV